MKNLEDLLYNTDFTQNDKSKEVIKGKLLNMLKYEEQKNHARREVFMKKNRYKPYAVAAAAVITFSVLIAACGEAIVEYIRQFSVGQFALFIAPDKGVNNRSNLGGTSFKASFNYEAEIEREKSIVTYFDTIDEVKPYLAFNPLMPVSLPTGFALDRISLFNDENGQPLPLGSNMFLNVYYTDTEKTQQIYVQLRMMDEETAFVATASHDMSYISINGHDGVVDGDNVSVEIDGIMYMIMAGMAESVTQHDVVMMARSIKNIE